MVCQELDWSEIEPGAVQELENVQTGVLVSVEESLKVKQSVLDLQEKNIDTAENASEEAQHEDIEDHNLQLQISEDSGDSTFAPPGAYASGLTFVLRSVSNLDLFDTKKIGFKSPAKCLDRAFQLLEPIKNYVEDIRKRERILSNASITGEVKPNHSWNIREHELACARAASLVDGSRTARAIAWMNVQNKWCTPAVQVTDNLKLGDCSQYLYDPL